MKSPPAHGAKWKPCGWLRGRKSRKWRGAENECLGRARRNGCLPGATCIQTRRFSAVWRLLAAISCPEKSWNRFTCAKPRSKKRRPRASSETYRENLRKNPGVVHSWYDIRFKGDLGQTSAL